MWQIKETQVIESWFCVGSRHHAVKMAPELQCARVSDLYVTGPGVGAAPVGVGDDILWLGLAGVEHLEVLLHGGLEILDRGLSVKLAGEHVEQTGVAVVEGCEPVLGTQK